MILDDARTYNNHKQTNLVITTDILVENLVVYIGQRYAIGHQQHPTCKIYSFVYNMLNIYNKLNIYKDALCIQYTKL